MKWTSEEITVLVVIVFVPAFIGGLFVMNFLQKSWIKDGTIIENGDKVYRVVEVKKVVTYQDIASSTVTGNAVYSGEK